MSGQRVIYTKTGNQGNQGNQPTQAASQNEQERRNSDPAVHPGGGLSHPEKSSSRRWLPSTASCFTSYLYRRRSSSVSSSPPKVIEPRTSFKQESNSVKLYTRSDSIRDVLEDALKILDLQAPYLPNILVEFLPLYNWSADHEMNIALNHSNTIASNDRGLFGVVSGPTLDPNTDHIVSLRLLDGIEFGIGVATNENMDKEAKRDFMCQKGGWGYYNYKTKHQGTRPKYPAGWYAEEHECVKKLAEKDIIYRDDVITVVVTREGLSDKEDAYTKPQPGNGLFTVRYFKNGVKMGGKENEFHHIQGPLRICLNYYFMSSTLQLLSDFKISKKVITDGLGPADD